MPLYPPPGSGSGAPTTANYLVGTADGGLSAEIVVGTSPGGELGGTWASPTIDDSVTVDSWTLTSPTLTTPVLGTPSSGTLTNCTALPVAGITSSTSTALGVGSLELGHATANTLTGSSGVLSIEGVRVLATNSTSGTQQGLIAVDATTGTVVGTVARANGLSTSGTPGTAVTSITAGASNQFVCIYCFGAQSNTANTQFTVTVTYSDTTTTTLSSNAATASGFQLNDAGMFTTPGINSTANSAKKITAIAVTTLGVGTGTRIAFLAAVEIPQ